MAERGAELVDDQLDRVRSLRGIGQVAEGEGSVEFFSSEYRHGFLLEAVGARDSDTPTGRGHLRRERSSSSPRRHHCAGRGAEIAARTASYRLLYLVDGRI